MNTASEKAFPPTAQAAFDIVGKYDQNSINGFSDNLIERMLAVVNPRKSRKILDAMGGDGNLTLSLYNYCDRHGIAYPEVVMFEYSRVQCELAKRSLADYPVTVIWGDITTLKTRDTEEVLEDSSFDCAMIKSANHELPLDSQALAYRNIRKVLKNDGHFVNLGILFDTEKERDEMRAIAKVKDTLAEMFEAARNRHFLTRDEFYSALTEAGFAQPTAIDEFTYDISSNKVADHYFSRFGAEKQKEYDLQHQIAQLRATNLRLKGRIIFDGDRSFMRCPGEITKVVKEAAQSHGVEAVYNKYPYSLLRDIQIHRELLAVTVNQVGKGASVLDLGCGLGLLAEQLMDRATAYRGIDISTDYIKQCQESFTQLSNFKFEQANLNSWEPTANSFDVCTILNVLYHRDLDPTKVLRNALRAVRPGGRIIVSGPTSIDSFNRAEPQIRKQLYDSNVLPQKSLEYENVLKANSSLLNDQGHYWSAEGMLALLLHLGCAKPIFVDNSLYYGNSYLVVVER